MPGSGVQHSMNIQRAQIMAIYRPTRSWSLRAGAMPVQVRTELSESGYISSDNRMYTLGGDLRRRWKKTVALLSTDFGLYEWRTSEGATSTVENHNVSLSIIEGERWSACATWSGMGGVNDSTMASTENVSLQFRFRASKSSLIDIGVQVPSEGQLGWMVEYRRPIGKRISVGLRGESFSRPDLFFTEEVWRDQKNGYNWTLLTSLTW